MMYNECKETRESFYFVRLRPKDFSTPLECFGAGAAVGLPVSWRALPGGAGLLNVVPLEGEEVGS